MKEKFPKKPEDSATLDEEIAYTEDTFDKNQCKECTQRDKCPLSK